MMTVVNAGEVWYIAARRTTAAEADRTIKLLQQFSRTALGLQRAGVLGELYVR